jgi:RimJ/RimL family protein N-acetyltransferase
MSASWPWPKIGPLETNLLFLTLLQPNDAETYRGFLIELRKEELLAKFLGLRPVCTVEQYRASLANLPRGEHYGIRWKDSGEFAGTCGFLPNSFVTAPEIFIWLGKHSRRQGAGTQVARRLLRAAFDQWKCDDVIGVPHPENGPSIRLLRKIGMQHCASILDFPEESFGFESQQSYNRFPIYCTLESPTTTTLR